MIQGPERRPGGTAPEWSPEVEVDVTLAAALIAEQFPRLAGEPVTPFAQGWDHTVHRVGDEWLFRFPRRSIALPGFAREHDALTALAPLLPLAVPVPRFQGEPSDRYPWPFAGSRLIVGDEAGIALLDDAARAALAVPLGEFLRALHSPAAFAAVGPALPEDFNQRAAMGARVPRTRERLAELAALDLGSDERPASLRAEARTGGRGQLWRPPRGLGALLDTALALPPPTATAVVHGDLHQRHVLIRDGALAGVIDWGDACRADPAVDLSIVTSLLPAAARPAFEAAYGEVPDERWLRARVLALSLCATLAVHAHHEGLREQQAEALAGLDRAAAG